MASWLDSLTPAQVAGMSNQMKMFFYGPMFARTQKQGIVDQLFQPVDTVVNTAVQAVSNTIAPVQTIQAQNNATMAKTYVDAAQAKAVSDAQAQASAAAEAQARAAAEAQARRQAEIAQHQATSTSLSVAPGDATSAAAAAAKTNESIRYVSTADELEARRKQAALSGGSSINLGQLGRRGFGGAPKTSLLG